MELHVSHDWDIEHNPSEIISSLVAVWFSVEGYDRDISNEEMQILNDFYDSLNLDENYDQIDGLGLGHISFREAMDVLDYEDKYIYIGSGTTPPCALFVQRQVLHRIYPIEFKYVFYVKERFKRKKEEVGALTNIRGIHPVNGHQIYYIGAARLQVGLAMTCILLYLV